MIFHNDLKIVWKHKLPHADENGAFSYENTKCTITKNKKLIGAGFAVCAKNDPFVKELGRKHSLARALKDAGFSKDKRTAIWETYINRK